MKRKFGYILFASGLLLSACGNKNQNQTHQIIETPYESESTMEESATGESTAGVNDKNIFMQDSGSGNHVIAELPEQNFVLPICILWTLKIGQN